MLTPRNITWDEFKKEQIHNKENYRNIVYRGHASNVWSLEPTLLRLFHKKKIEKSSIRSSEYFGLTKQIAENYPIEGLSALNTPSKNPFLTSIMYGDEQHHSEMQNTFSLILELRHLRFPSPIIDWTHSFYVAAGFALLDSLDSSVNECIIYCLREKTPKEGAPFNLFEPDFFIIPNEAIRIQPERHKRQMSAYSICPYNSSGNYYQQIRDTVFYLPAEELLIKNSNSKFELIKFNICDIENVRNELKKEGIDRQFLYGDSRIKEEEQLQLIAEKYFSESK